MFDREISKTLRILYYGGGVSGCTTNMFYLASQVGNTEELPRVTPYFTLTDVACQRLRDGGIPETSILSLQSLRHQEFDSYHLFTLAIQKVIDNDHLPFTPHELLPDRDSLCPGIRCLLTASGCHHSGIRFSQQEYAQIGLYKPFFSTYRDPLRREILHGIDGIIFVIDSQEDRLEGNMSALHELEENLLTHGKVLTSVPWVIQYNKRDLPHIFPVQRLEEMVNHDHVPFIEAVASQGRGVLETFQQLLHHIEQNV